MIVREVMTGELLDDVALSLEELAIACRVQTHWIVERVHAGVILTQTLDQPASTRTAGPSDTMEYRFTSASVVRTRRLVRIERDFDANLELAALVVDLIEEVDRLRSPLRKG